VIAGSQAGNFIRLGHAHPVVIATWRLVLASVLLFPAAAPRFGLYRRLSKAQLGWLVLAAACMAAHLFLWIAGVQHTTVANASMAFSINPVITAAGAYIVFGERVSKKLAASIALGICGIAALGWADLRLQTGHFVGDALAVLSSGLFTVYFLTGKKLRETLPIEVYVTALYGIAGLFGVGVMFALDLPFSGYDRGTWVCFLSLAVVPTVIGHSSLNYAVKYVDASRISTAMLSEPLLAGVVAYFAWGEAITAGALVGYVLICASVVILFWDQWSSRPATCAQ
jgi:drug/metabolite transporter (DMT)-like permease